MLTTQDRTLHQLASGARLVAQEGEQSSARYEEAGETPGTVTTAAASPGQGPSFLGSAPLGSGPRSSLAPPHLWTQCEHTVRGPGRAPSADTEPAGARADPASGAGTKSAAPQRPGRRSVPAAAGDTGSNVITNRRAVLLLARHKLAREDHRARGGLSVKGTWTPARGPRVHSHSQPWPQDDKPTQRVPHGPCTPPTLCLRRSFKRMQCLALAGVA